MPFTWKAVLKPLVWITALLVFVLDQATKYSILTYIPYGGKIEVCPFLNIIHTTNTGAAFGIFHQTSGWFRLIFFGVVTIVCLYLLIYWLGTTPVKDRLQRFSLALILGGALGNVVDRVLYGHVTDFIDVYYGNYHWPAFNIADSGITVGVVLIFVKLLPPFIAQYKKQKTSS